MKRVIHSGLDVYVFSNIYSGVQIKKNVIHNGLDVYVFSHIYNGVQIKKNEKTIGVYKGILDIENADADYLMEMVYSKFLAE